MSSVIRQVAKHTPLIKFPQRKPGGIIVKPSSQTATKPASSSAPSSSTSVPYVPQKGTITNRVESSSSLPPIYRRKPLSQIEQDLVPLGGASPYVAKPAKGKSS